MASMRAVVLTQLGAARKSFRVETRPIPNPQPGHIIIRIKAFGLNHSELSTRLGEFNPIGDVPLPRVLGIECVGIVESAPDSEAEFPKGTAVMAALGGMGRAFDGSYAEFCAVPKNFVIPIAPSEKDLKLSWDILGALPEMLQTAHGCLFRSLQLKAGENLLIRGATSSVGLAAIGIGKHAGATVVATTRSPANETMLEESGADHVIIDKDAKIQDAVREVFPAGVDKILDLVGAKTAPDSLKCLAVGGVCCSAGTLGGPWVIENFIPNLMLPIGRYLTSYGEFTFRKQNAPWDQLLEQVQNGNIKIKLGKVYQGVDRVIEAHELMEQNEANGKIVIVL